MPKVLSYEADILGGATVRSKLVVPILAADPATPGEGWVWINDTDHALRWYENGFTHSAGESTLDTEAVIDAVAAALTQGNNIDITYNDTTGTITVDVEALTSGDITDFTTAVRAAISITDTATLNLSYAGGAISGDVLDSPLLEGSNKAYYRSTDNHVDGTTNHVFTAADDTKLAGVATGATANSTDAQLRDRTTHTGTQLAATISDFAAAVDALAIDADTLEGLTLAQVQSAVEAAIVDSAPGTLDTLNELAAALGDDPNFAATTATALAAKARAGDFALTGGALTEVVTHSLNTRKLRAQVYVDSGDFEDEDYVIQRTSVNTITVVSEGQNIPAGRRVFITAIGA